MSLGSAINMNTLAEGVYSAMLVEPLSIEVDADGNIVKMTFTDNMVQVITP